ncbi:hypothetical protein M9H77_27426 [Catharanthus roseus]|uniref:Uncharacterized protein n=1 Tax=Catharanthus roseus TaxID=4058 RepID=A0ACC0ACG7_CATRO|nr:hypothetical protein M9H77_27426 [Catharanthus roseus]
MLIVTQTVNNVDRRSLSPRASSVGVSVTIYSSVTVRLHVKKEPLEAWILRAFTGSETDDDLIMRTRGFIFLLLGGHAVVHGSFRGCTTYRGSLSHSTGLGVVAYSCIAAQLMTDVQGDPLAPLGAIWCTSFDCSQLPTHILVAYRDHLYGSLIMIVVYIRNPANRDTRSVGHQPAWIDKRMMTSMLQELGFDATFLVISKWIRDITPPPSPGLRFAPFHSPHHTSLEFSSFRAPPPPGTTGSSTPHQPISHASSSDEEERTMYE